MCLNLVYLMSNTYRQDGIPLSIFLLLVEVVHRFKYSMLIVFDATLIISSFVQHLCVQCNLSRWKYDIRVVELLFLKLLNSISYLLSLLHKSLLFHFVRKLVFS